MTLGEADGLRVLHMGDLGHMLSPEQLAALGRVDVLLIPVGGFYTIDARQAAELAKKIAPAVTVPMHYRGDGFGYDVIAPVSYTHLKRIKNSDFAQFHPIYRVCWQHEAAI